MVLYYIAKYCAKAETKTAKLDKFMKSIFWHISSKNSIDLLVTKFMNKLIEEKNISAQKMCYLFLSLNLTSLSFLINSMNVQPQEQFNHTLTFIDKKNSLPIDIYLKKYCNHSKKMEKKILYQIHTFYK